jgi:hypothetical protein
MCEVVKMIDGALGGSENSGSVVWCYLRSTYAGRGSQEGVLYWEECAKLVLEPAENSATVYV